ncbi:MAG: hypothetical protein KBS74_05245 [Clostridiales bacterium]|nr:hypothetical protein [Candidatus Cacconaster stercorequi]
MAVMLLRDGVIALLAAIGLTVILWGAAELIFRKREGHSAAVVVLPMCGTAVEYDLQTLLAQRRRLGSDAAIVLLDRGLSDEDRRRAEWLTKRYEGVVLLTADELTEYWKRT